MSEAILILHVVKRVQSSQWWHNLRCVEAEKYVIRSACSIGISQRRQARAEHVYTHRRVLEQVCRRSAGQADGVVEVCRGGQWQHSAHGAACKGRQLRAHRNRDGAGRRHTGPYPAEQSVRLLTVYMNLNMNIMHQI